MVCKTSEGRINKTALGDGRKTWGARMKEMRIGVRKKKVKKKSKKK